MAATLFDLAKSFRKLKEATAALRAAPSDRNLQMRVCLESRSAYTDFYAEAEYQQQIDCEAAKQLQDLLEDAMDAIPAREDVISEDGVQEVRDNKYRHSVASRLEDFESFIAEMGERPPLDTGIPEL